MKFKSNDPRLLRISELIPKHDNSSLEELKGIINSYEYKEDLVKPFIEYKFGNNLTVQETDALASILAAANKVYSYSGEETGLSDSEYDQLVDYFMHCASDEELPISQPIVDNGNKVLHHTYPTLRGTLDKIYYLREGDDKSGNRTGLPEWMKKIEKMVRDATGTCADLRNEDVLVFPKFDGESCEEELDENEELIVALTRGDTEVNAAQDITKAVRPIHKKPNVKLGRPIGLKNEAMMSEEAFAEYNRIYREGKGLTPYKQSRSAVTSILHSNDPGDKSQFITLIPLRYSYIDDSGVESLQQLPPSAFSVPYIRCKLGDVEAIDMFAQNHRYVFVNNETFRCDGAVIYLTNKTLQRILGRKNERQMFEVAYKFTEEVATTTVKDVKFQVGRTGKITPVLKVKPVAMKGNTISSVTLGSMNLFLQKGIAKGDHVEIKYDIIPVCGEIDHRYKHSLFSAPTYCPECNEVLVMDGAEMFCKNTSCPSRRKGKILDYIDRMRIKGIGPAVVDDLWDLGILKWISDLYTLGSHKQEMLKLSGYGPAKIDNILEAIDSRRSCTWSTVLGSIGIPGCSIKTFQKIFANVKNMDDVWTRVDRKIGFADLPDIGPKTSDALLKGLDENRSLIYYLSVHLDIHNDVISGMKRVCFTKCRPDDNMLKTMNDLGAVLDDSLTKKTDILVIPMEGVVSSKVKSAIKYGKPVIEYSDLIEYLKNN